MINKKAYLEQVKEIVTARNVDENDFLVVLEILEGKLKINPVFVADKLVEKIFGGIYQEILVPWSFYNTEVGKAILKLKFGIDNNNFYLIEDLKNITGYTKQYITQELKSGNIKGEKRGGTWVMKEKDVNEYLVRKGKSSLYNILNIEYEDIKKELNLDSYWKG